MNKKKRESKKNKNKKRKQVIITLNIKEINVFFGTLKTVYNYLFQTFFLKSTFDNPLLDYLNMLTVKLIKHVNVVLLTKES